MKKMISGSVLLCFILLTPFAIGGGERKDLDYAQVVNVRAKCNVHGFGGREITVDLSRLKGDGYEVIPLDK